MFNIIIDEQYRREELGTSDGTQRKYYKDGYWYKTNSLGYEDEVEYLSSGILQFSSLKPREYVQYDKGLINGDKGCRSKNFLKLNESFFTLNHIHKNVTGIPMHKKINQIETLKMQSDYVIEFIKSVTDIDLTDYLRKNFTLDFIILNEDRHFNNLGIIMNDQGKYRVAPVFDNGKALFNGNFSVKDDLPIGENIKRVICRPFGHTHRALFEYFGKGFDLDVNKALAWLNRQENSYQKDVLKFQLENNMEIFEN